jgi:hypothetical protein
MELAAQQYWRAVTDYWHEQYREIDWRVRLGESKFDVFIDHDRIYLDHSGQKPFCDNDNWMPDLVVVSGGGYPLEEKYLTAAKANGIPTISSFDTWYGYRQRFTFDGILIMPDRLLTIDKRMIDEATKEGLPADIMIAVGQPAWETIAKLPSSKSNTVLFLDAPVTRDYGQSLGYTEMDTWNSVLAARQKQPALFETLLVAPHPAGRDWPDTKNVTIMRYKPECLQEVGTVIGMFSAPMVHAFLAGRRVISLQPNATDIDMCPLSRHGYIQRSSSAEDLLMRMTDPPASPKTLSDTVANSARTITQFLKQTNFS